MVKPIPGPENPAVPSAAIYRGLAGVPPAVVAICLTVIVVIVIICGAFLAVTTHDPTSFRALLNTLLNAGSLLLGGGGMLYSASAANKAGKAVEQTNGNLDFRIKQAVRSVIQEGSPQ